ncbi:MAG: VOC family protein [Acidobacteriaceae bacterium]|nr:VOC family protein [Acidobacteriaceae bacterium]
MSSPGANTSPSRFVWYELHTPRAKPAEAFYRPVLGWGAQDGGVPNHPYTLVTIGGIPIGGLLEKPATSFARGEKAHWVGYIGVGNVDEFSKRVQQAGGVVHRAAEDIPSVGRFAVVADPQGAMFVLFQPRDTRQQAQFPKPGTPGSAAWHDLAAVDWQSEFAFYSDLFGWSKSDALDMGPAGTYQIFSAGSEPIGGMMNRMDASQTPGWLFYFNVDDINAAIDRVKQHGGTIVHGPSVVPGGQQIAHCLDTQGAIFGIVAPAKG